MDPGSYYPSAPAMPSVASAAPRLISSSVASALGVKCMFTFGSVYWLLALFATFMGFLMSVFSGSGITGIFFKTLGYGITWGLLGSLIPAGLYWLICKFSPTVATYVLAGWMVLFTLLVLYDSVRGMISGKDDPKPEEKPAPAAPPSKADTYRMGRPARRLVPFDEV